MEQITCPFCNPEPDEIIAKNALCYAKWDKYPASQGHLLVIPFRHTPDFFSLTRGERDAVFDLIGHCRETVGKKYQPDGYNIGFNIGEAAGQTVMHCHCHVIPRYKGDVPRVKGGIRGVIPEKQEY